MNEMTKQEFSCLLRDSAIELTLKEKEIVDDWKSGGITLYDIIADYSVDLGLTEEELFAKRDELDWYIEQEMKSFAHTSIYDVLDCANIEKFRDDMYDKRTDIRNVACISQIADWIREGKDIRDGDINKVPKFDIIDCTWEQVEKELREEFLNE